ncbi:peptidoglycan DD-metalloendopeptidase family protein [Candidatus Collierbacteria bacterium]|nr:peptidoglycan DD-metalloendopeptidase family protein [Candidatus Collierbacteria bacterium]
MAVDRRYLLDLIARVKAFDSNREWEKLSISEKNLLEEFATYYGSESGIDTATGYDLLSKLKNPKTSRDFLAIIQSLETIEASFDEVTTGTIPPEVLAEYQEYLKQAKQQAASPGVVSPQTSLAETIKKAQYFYQLRLKAEALRAAHYAVNHPNLDPTKDAAAVAAIINTEIQENNDTITSTVNQQKESIEKTTLPVANISALYVEKVAASLNITLTESQKNEAVLTLASFIYSGGVEDLIDPLTDDPHLALIPEKINLASRNLVGATSLIIQETLAPTTPQQVDTPHEKAQAELQSFLHSNTIPTSPKDQRPAIVLGQASIGQIEAISTGILASDYLIPEALQAASQNVYQVQLKLASAGLARYSSVDLTFISDAELQTFITSYQHDHPGELISPTLIQTYNSEKTKAAIKGVDPSNKNHLSGIEAYHQGVHLDVIRAMANAKPGSDLDKLAKEKPGLVSRLIRVVNPIENSRLGQSGEINTPTHNARVSSTNPLRQLYNSTFGTASRGLSKIVDIIGSRNPGLGKALNFVRSPLRSALRPIFAWAGRQAGSQVARQFIQNVAAKAIGKIASEGVKKIAQTLISEGLKQGLKTLIIQGAAALGLDLAVGATGVGIPLAVVMLVIQVGLMVLGAAIDFVKNNSKDISEQVIGAAVMFFTGVSAFFAGMVAVAVATGMALLTIVIISILLGSTMYVAVNNIAPIITTIAHLESGISDTSRVGVIGEGSPALLPPGPLPDSCPQGSPQSGYGVTQGPNVGSHTSGWGINIAGVAFISEGEAIDYGTPMNTPIYATHDGQAYYYQQYDNPPDGYGNYVAIIGNCPNSATGQTVQFLTTYAHLNAGNISRGGPTTVTRGQMIGLSDNSGHSTGPHLHYEIFGLGDINRYVGP